MCRVKIFSCLFFIDNDGSPVFFYIFCKRTPLDFSLSFSGCRCREVSISIQGMSISAGAAPNTMVFFPTSGHIRKPLFWHPPRKGLHRDDFLRSATLYGFFSPVWHLRAESREHMRAQAWRDRGPPGCCARRRGVRGSGSGSTPPRGRTVAGGSGATIAAAAAAAAAAGAAPRASFCVTCDIAPDSERPVRHPPNKQ